MFSFVGLVITLVLISSLTAQSDTNSANESLSADNVVSRQTSSTFYNGCDSTKGCFGFPNGCIESTSCQGAFSVQYENSAYIFELFSGSTAAVWVSVALSADTLMGDDSGVECVLENGTVNAYATWISTSSSRTNVPNDTIQLTESSYVNQQVYCKFERAVVTTVRNKVFDLDTDMYHILVASGTNAATGAIQQHNIGKIASASARFLNDYSSYDGVSQKMLKVHGILMVCAWLGSASIGIVIARYFKQTWLATPLFGVNQWFIWHRVCMTVTWSLTIAAFVIIFVEIDGWTKSAKTHAVLGTITTGLCFLQPFGAFLRPPPDHKYRYIFNIAHFAGGNAAYILAICTIFFAIRLTKAELPEWLFYLLTCFVAFYVAYHVLLTVLDCYSEKKIKSLKSALNSDDGKVKDAPYSGTRQMALATFLIIAIAFTVVFAVIIGRSPID